MNNLSARAASGAATHGLLRENPTPQDNPAALAPLKPNTPHPMESMTTSEIIDRINEIEAV